jgi:TPP-dependent pyruvate/acetoin dehydrogenase alpha subunit
MVPVASGVALAARIRKESTVVMNWVGDGSVKAGVSHEGLNFAAVQRLPVVYILQNNQVALGTRLEQHHVADDFAAWPDAYGMAGGIFDGNNVLDLRRRGARGGGVPRRSGARAAGRRDVPDGRPRDPR